VDRRRDDIEPDEAALLDVRVPGGQITEEGLRLNVSVGIQYLASWLRGTGAAAINDLMEDAATAEISRSQVWQWARHGARTARGERITSEMVRRVIDEEIERLRSEWGKEAIDGGGFAKAADLFGRLALAEEFPRFLTIPAYDLI
jgi:malate synthase